MERRDIGGEGLHAQAVMVGGHRVVYVSGQVAADATGLPVDGDIAAQADVVFGRIQSLLGDYGASLDDVVKITTFLTDMDDYTEFSRVRARFFPERKPASTTVAVRALSDPRFLIEVEAVAAID